MGHLTRMQTLPYLEVKDDERCLTKHKTFAIVSHKLTIFSMEGRTGYKY